MNVIVHVGVHKTATSLLQRSFFPALEQIRYYDLRSDRHLLNYLLAADDLEFVPRQAYEFFCSGAKQLRGDGPVVLSDEQFYGSPWDGCLARVRTIDRIAQVFPDATVVVVLRNQPDLLQSLYLHYIRTGGTAHWKDFLDSRTHPLVFTNAFFKYREYVQYLWHLFGKRQVHVLLYEDMTRAGQSYLNNWCQLLGVSEDAWDPAILNTRWNPSIGPGTVPLIRALNKIGKSARQPHLLLSTRLRHVSVVAITRLSTLFFRNARRNVIPSAKVRQFLQGCEEGNRLLAQELKRDLKSLGYPVN